MCSDCKNKEIESLRLLLAEAVKVMWEYARFETEEGKARAFLSKLEASHAKA